MSDSRTKPTAKILWMLAAAFLLALAWWLEDRVGAALDVTNRTALKDFAWWCSKIGEGWVPAAVGGGLAVLFLWINRPGVAAKIFFAMLTCEITGLAATILRSIFGRTRPLNRDVPQGFYGLWHDGHWIAGQFKFSSFPSGHAATAAGLAAAVWLIHRGWGTLMVFYALAVMWSRVALQCHHLSDVVASTILSIALAIWSKRFLLPTVAFQFGNLHRIVRRK